MHHVAVEVEDCESTLAELEAAGATLVDTKPRKGLGGHEVAFVHPDSVHGVLVEVISRG
jgi:methylmalonyl-CoA/ethylmalonyl-CoA epimerase